MRAKRDQRAEIRFCQQIGKSRSETLLHLQNIHGNNALSKSQVNKWFAKFQNGHTQLADQPQNLNWTKLTPVKVQQINNIVNQTRTVTTCSLARQVQLSVGSVHKCLRKNLQLRKKPAKWVPHFLMPAQKQCRVLLAR